MSMRGLRSYLRSPIDLNTILTHNLADFLCRFQALSKLIGEVLEAEGRQIYIENPNFANS